MALTLDEAKQEIDRQANVRDLATWMNRNRPLLRTCLQPATTHFHTRMQHLKQATTA
jgi:hypothetical protein